MSQRQLWALFVASSIAAAVGPVIAQWASARLDVEPVIDQEPEPYVDEDECFPMPGRAESDSEHPLAPDWRETLQNRAESDSEGHSAPPGPRR